MSSYLLYWLLLCTEVFIAWYISVARYMLLWGSVWVLNRRGMLKSCDVTPGLAHMFTANSLVVLRHQLGGCARLFSVHMLDSQWARESPDYQFVNRMSADHDWHLRVSWLNVRSLANKSTAVHKTTVAHRVSCGISVTAELLVPFSTLSACIRKGV